MSKLRGRVKDAVVLGSLLALPEGHEGIVLYPAEHPLAPFAGCLCAQDARQMLQAIRTTRKSKKRPPNL